MGKALYIAEKPSVAQEFAKALKIQTARRDGYLESNDSIVTWCVGHLVTMSYPDAYDPALKRWSMETLPFIPQTWRYEVIPSAKKQFKIVKSLLNRSDVDMIYVCTDSGREGEYIYRLVAQESGVKDKAQRRVWIDSQTEEEVLRGIREAKDLSVYDHLADAAYLRAKEDYLMGINFSRVLTLKYGNQLAYCLGEKRCVISVGRVMTCVLGMIVRREREIRAFVKTPFYRLNALTDVGKEEDNRIIACEWRAVEGSKWFGSPKLYKENGCKTKEDALALVKGFGPDRPLNAIVQKIERKTEKKNPPLLYNLAELQNDCSKRFHISPDQTLAIAQELYEKKLITYPRTDARVLSSAVAKEIQRNLSGLTHFDPAAAYANEILSNGQYTAIGKSRYTDDKQITDHYALIPTGQGIGALKSLSATAYGVYCLIVRRFLSIFYPPAKYSKVNLQVVCQKENFFGGVKVLTDPGYLSVMPGKKKDENEAKQEETGGDEQKTVQNPQLLEALSHLRKGSHVVIRDFEIKEGETTPPKRYNSGSMILAMENAGQLIEDEELRAQIKGSGIGTSATRSEILKKLVSNGYINLNKKTQILTPTLMGEMIHDIVYLSIGSLLNPDLTASWEKGLTFVAEGKVTSAQYMDKLSAFVRKNTDQVKTSVGYQQTLRARYTENSRFYPTKKSHVQGAKTHRPSEDSQKEKSGSV